MGSWEMILLAVNSLVWMGVAYMAYCRSLILDRTTRWGVSVGVSALGTCAVGMAVFPYLPHFRLQPYGITIWLGLALFVFLYSFRNTWRYGQPDGIQR